MCARTTTQTQQQASVCELLPRLSAVQALVSLALFWADHLPLPYECFCSVCFVFLLICLNFVVLFVLFLLIQLFLFGKCRHLFTFLSVAFCFFADSLLDVVVSLLTTRTIYTSSVPFCLFCLRRPQRAVTAASFCSQYSDRSDSVCCNRGRQTHLRSMLFCTVF